MAKTGIDDINTAYAKLSGLYEKFESLLSRLPQQSLSLNSVPATLPAEQEPHKTNPVMGLGSLIKKPADEYAQPIAILSTKSSMALKSSTHLVKESNNVIDKITHLLQVAPQLDDGSIFSKISSLKIPIEQSYQLIEQLKKQVDSLAKEQSGQDVLNRLNTLVAEIQDEKTKIVEANKKLLKELENLFELPVLATNALQKDKLFANQIYVASDEFKGKIIEAQRQYNDLNNQFFQYNGEAKSIKKDFDLLWKDKETRDSEISVKIKLLDLLKNEKVTSLQQKMKSSLEPLWSLAMDKHNTLIEKIDSKLQETVDGTVVQGLTHLKNESDLKFKDIVNLHQEYQSKMPNNKLLVDIFDKKQKEINVRLREIMLEIFTFAEQQEKQVKKISA